MNHTHLPTSSSTYMTWTHVKAYSFTSIMNASDIGEPEKQKAHFTRWLKEESFCFLCANEMIDISKVAECYIMSSSIAQSLRTHTHLYIYTYIERVSQVKKPVRERQRERERPPVPAYIVSSLQMFILDQTGGQLVAIDPLQGRVSERTWNFSFWEREGGESHTHTASSDASTHANEETDPHQQKRTHTHTVSKIK